MRVLGRSVQRALGSVLPPMLWTRNALAVEVLPRKMAKPARVCVRRWFCLRIVRVVGQTSPCIGQKAKPQLPRLGVDALAELYNISTSKERPLFQSLACWCKLRTAKRNRAQLEKHMASQSITKLYEHAKSARESLRRYRAKEREQTTGLIQRAGTAASSVGGLLVAAVIDGKWGYDNKRVFGAESPELHGIACVGPVPINAALGVAAIVAGIPGALPGSEYIATAGASLLGYPIAKSVEAKIVERSAK